MCMGDIIMKGEKEMNWTPWKQKHIFPLLLFYSNKKIVISCCAGKQRCIVSLKRLSHIIIGKYKHVGDKNTGNSYLQLLT